MHDRSDKVLKLIGIFRLVKALLLVAVGIGVLRLVQNGQLSRVNRWVSEQMPFAAHYAFVQNAIATVMRMSPHRIEIAGAAAFAYAALFTTEGVGLILGKVWAEWLTVVATTSLVPFEIYEVVRRATPIRIGVLVANIAIVIYLLIRLRRLK